MPMTPFMQQMANLMESQLRPGLAEFVEREYKQRSTEAPTPARTKELVQACIDAMRLKLEHCFDTKVGVMDAKNHCLLAIRLELANQLDKEFPQIVLAES